MKVTKLIREYVTDGVSKVYDAKQNPYSEQAEIDRQKVKDFQSELENRQREAIEKFFSENVVYEEMWGGSIRVAKPSASTPSFSYYKTQAMLDEKKWKEENTRQKNSKVREIILNLELGATRQELDEMMKRLLEEA